ncbi:terminase small subunit [Oxalobacter aliiformigenes]|uniref:terminase small subunit n=1 Tax=Oxalobacter aliiformigenes TaxID=2946593 RepID=UPI0022AE57BA|nr:terminase small subunit [Oxalobacter aliiformigenes]MCZ4064114.1 terminase small subunit [Oxalobacter aliiformigenes]WAV99490.1 terminase small subunit [Oxalobacter aliiformigenes]
MRGLTQKQENFCLAYIETGNASEAYRRAYNADGMKPETVNRKAKELLDNGKITARLEELRKPATESAQITLAQHLSTLEELRELAKEEGKYGPAIQAEIARGKAAGLYVERSHIDGEITVRWDE